MTFSGHFALNLFFAGMLGALKPGFRSLATLKLVVNDVDELQIDNNSCSIARFPCNSTAFLCLLGLQLYFAHFMPYAYLGTKYLA